jgi:hypothetical protein
LPCSQQRLALSLAAPGKALTMFALYIGRRPPRLVDSDQPGAASYHLDRSPTGLSVL